ncbi:uncharacterized protein LOC112639962 [Camponotus floridanus]|uniref:uncharacterized protein LOC112639962 n=1 Tax=Camponotus floridanus TaxID=104421 RepID=UPI000DC66A93|nr:uncharacterized protein LOC112639962 [Camponotus floridanus]
MEEINLLLVNSGNTPTCTRQQRNSIVDLTWATPKILGRIEKWTVEDTVLSLSDHNYITYSINIGKRTSIPVVPTSTSRRWKTDNMDEELFEEAIEWSCHSYISQDTTIVNDVEWIDKTIAQAADLSMKELSELAKLYKEAKKELSQAIYNAKENSWKELIREIDKDPWGISYKLVMNKLKISGPGISEIFEEHILKEVIHKLFPRDDNKDNNIELRVREWKDEWDVSFAETNKALRRKGARNTAPGIDGINNKMWKKTPDNMINKVAEIFTKCMRHGEFPTQWKRARLVLIPKGKIEEQRIPKARPICLIDDIGKGLERIIVERIENWTQEMANRGYHNLTICKDQYGFRRNKSTIDALSRVIERAKESRHTGRVTMLLCLDIENAFNSIPWKEIGNTLKKQKFPKYLRKILHSYFHNRCVEYTNKSGEIVKTSVERGVPQGSVLRPLIWNLVYDQVLRIKKEENCEVIGYADDTLVMATADTYKEAKFTAYIQAERLIRTIRNMGFKVAVEKTEAMIFFGMILDSKLSFAEHFRYISEKVEKVKKALCRLMPNLRGPHESKRLEKTIRLHHTIHSYVRCTSVRIKKTESAMCSYCEGGIDNAEHTLCQCDEWTREREEMKEEMNNNINLRTFIEAICTSKEIYLAANTFAHKVMGKKEEDERIRQRREQECASGPLLTP